MVSRILYSWSPIAQLPRAGEGGEVGDGRLGVGLHEGPREGCRDDGKRDRAGDEADPTRSGDAERQEQQHRPDEVELLLDGSDQKCRSGETAPVSVK